jgi:hypothetical protein
MISFYVACHFCFLVILSKAKNLLEIPRSQVDILATVKVIMYPDMKFVKPVDNFLAV